MAWRTGVGVRVGTALFALLIGCGGSSNSGGSGGVSGGVATASDAQAMCGAMCNHETQCGTAPGACESQCLTRLGDAAKFRQDFAQAYAACMNSADCTTDADACVLTATEKVAPNWQADPARQSCVARQSECQTFNDDICGSVTTMTASGRKQVADCLAKPCNEIADCLGSIP